MKIRIASRLDIGKTRENNEDALAYCPDVARGEWQEGDMAEYVTLGDWGCMAVVADGMGGANAGEVASQLAVQAVKDMMTAERVAAAASVGDDTIKSLLEASVRHADAAIQERMAHDTGTRGMGTTIVMCWVMGDKAHIAWCGDSRCYSYLPSRGLTPLTRDHSLVQEMVDNGELTPDEAFHHPDGNIITKGLGDVDCDIEPDFCIHTVKENETLLLCSDGLCGYCHDRELEACMDNHCANVTQCCDELLQLALDAGGHDNIGIIAVSIIPDERDEPATVSLLQAVKRGLKRMMGR